MHCDDEFPIAAAKTFSFAGFEFDCFSISSGTWLLKCSPFFSVQATEKKDGFEEMGLEGSAFEALERDFQEVLQVQIFEAFLQHDNLVR